MKEVEWNSSHEYSHFRETLNHTHGDNNPGFVHLTVT